MSHIDVTVSPPTKIRHIEALIGAKYQNHCTAHSTAVVSHRTEMNLLGIIGTQSWAALIQFPALVPFPPSYFWEYLKIIERTLFVEPN